MPDNCLIACDVGVAGATKIEISGGLGLIWVRENLVKSGHVASPVGQFTFPFGVTADSVLAFTLAQRETSEDQRPKIRLPFSAAEKPAEQSRLEILFTSFATEVRGEDGSSRSQYHFLEIKGTRATGSNPTFSKLRQSLSGSSPDRGPPEGQSILSGFQRNIQTTTTRGPRRTKSPSGKRTIPISLF